VGGEFREPYRGALVGGTHYFALRVYFEDTDVAGIVYYANYLRFMERARSDMLRAVGVDQRAALESGRRASMRSPSRSQIPAPRKLDDDLLVSYRSSGGARRQRAHSSKGHADRTNSRGRYGDGRVPLSRRPSQAPAARMGRDVRAAARGRLRVSNVEAASPDMSPVALFLQADIVVKGVMVGLVLASVWTWAIIIAHALKIRRIARENARFELEFAKAEDIDRFYDQRGREELPSAKVFAAGLAEWRRSTAGAKVDREGARSRLATVMHSAVAAEVDRLAERLNILATIGSVAPFVGLFGTVWGIMRSFNDIAGANNTSLAVVAPGIAEALFATAIGLFAAIPAVIAYNRMSYGINRIEARLSRFADGFHGALSRELEREG
jgi:biopolymer transport protein TolQ